MMSRLVAALVCAILSTAAQAETTAKVFDPHDYQVFVSRWTPEGTPLCAAIESAGDWSQILHPAPVMSGNKAFAPPADFWKGHAVLLVARTVPGGSDTTQIFHFKGVSEVAGVTTVGESFTPPPPASYQINWYMAVAVPKPLAAQIQFVENGKPICTLKPAAGLWVSPAPETK